MHPTDEVAMDPLSADTPRHVRQIQIELLNRMPTWRKLQLVDDLNRMVKQFALAGLRERHLGDSPELLQRRLADLSLGPELAAKVYGPLPEEG